MFAIKGLTLDESRIAIAAVRAIADGPFFPPEFDDALWAVVGFDRPGLRFVHARLHQEDELDEIMTKAINVSLMHLCIQSQSLGLEKEVSRWVAATPAEVESLMHKWISLYPL